MSGSGVHGGSLPEGMNDSMPAQSPKSYCSVARIHLPAFPEHQAHLLNTPINSLSFLSLVTVPWFYHLVEGAGEWLKSVSPGMLVCPMSTSKPLSQPIENWEPPSSLLQGTGRFQSTGDKLHSSIPGGYKLSVLWKVTAPPNVVMGQRPSVWGYFLSGTLAWPYRICPLRDLERKYAM